MVLIPALLGSLQTKMQLGFFREGDVTALLPR